MKNLRIGVCLLVALLIYTASTAMPSISAGTLKLHLPFDEPTGETTFTDSSGNGNDGTCAGLSCPAAGVSGMDGTAFSFDGSDDYVEVAYDMSLNPAGSFTVVAWAKMSQDTARYRSVIVSQDTSLSPLLANGYALHATNFDQWQFRVGSESGTWIYAGSAAVSLGTWTHLAGVYDASAQTIRLYVNGTLSGSPVNAVIEPNTHRPLRVGAGATEGAANSHFPGTIDDVRVYNEALSQTEIQALLPINPTCFVETTGNDITDYSSANAGAVQTAIDNASPGDTLKVAGTCAGTPSGNAQSVYLGQSVTLQGGYTRTHWLATPDPATHVTTLDAQKAGRVLYVPAGTTATVDGLTLTRGKADNGGGIYNAGTLTLTQSVVHDNAATTYGGGMYNDGTSPTLIDVTFSDNSSDNYGGGMYNDGRGGNSSPTLTDVTFTGNSTSQRGGGIYNYGGGGISTPILTNVTFRDNTANTGGAIHFYGDNGDVSATITNGRFDANGASHIGYDDGNADTQPHFINCTFYGATSQVVDILYFDSGRTPIDVTNSIFWGNNGDLTDDDAALNVTHSIVEESSYASDTGNVYADPQFVDAAGGNLRVRQGSPAIDNGDNSVVPAGATTDLDDLERFVGWAVDMGAYESQYEEICEFAAGAPITLGAGQPITLTFGTAADLGTLSCITVTYVPTSHPTATVPLQTAAFWTLGAAPATATFTVTLTFPYAQADATSRACRYPGGLGGAGWDCGDGTHTTYDANTWVRRSHVTGFSAWAVGNDVGPTATTLTDFRARGPAIELSAFGVSALLGVGFVLVRRVQPERER